MIGKVVFDNGDYAGTEAVMDDKGQWSHPDELMEMKLRYDFAAGDFGPAVMPFGYNAIHEAAYKLGGYAVIENPPQPLPEGFIS
jgi:hypothetical protein